MAKNDMILWAQSWSSALIMPNKTVAKTQVKTPVVPKKVVSSAPIYKPSTPVSVKPTNFSTPWLNINQSTAPWIKIGVDTKPFSNISIPKPTGIDTTTPFKITKTPEVTTAPDLSMRWNIGRSYNKSWVWSLLEFVGKTAKSTVADYGKWLEQNALRIWWAAERLLNKFGKITTQSPTLTSPEQMKAVADQWAIELRTQPKTTVAEDVADIAIWTIRWWISLAAPEAIIGFQELEKNSVTQPVMRGFNTVIQWAVGEMKKTNVGKALVYSIWEQNATDILTDFSYGMAFAWAHEAVWGIKSKLPSFGKDMVAVETLTNSYNRDVKTVMGENYKWPQPSPDMIKAQATKLLSEYHPDKPTGNTQKFQEVVAARDRLINTEAQLKEVTDRVKQTINDESFKGKFKETIDLLKDTKSNLAKKFQDFVESKKQEIVPEKPIEPVNHFESVYKTTPVAPAIKIPEIIPEESPVLEKDAMYQEKNNSIKLNWSKKSIIKKADARFWVNNYEVEFLPGDWWNYHAVVTPKEIQWIDFVSQKLWLEKMDWGLRPDEVIGNSYLLKWKDSQLQISINEKPNEIQITNIHTKELWDLTKVSKWTGLWTNVLNELKNYADESWKKLVIIESTPSAKSYYEKLWFLKPDDSVYYIEKWEKIPANNSFSYIPKETKFQEKSTSKTITSDDAIKTAQERYPSIMKHLSIEAVEKIFTPKGTEAFWSYKDRLIQLANNPKEFTMDHEIFHAALDLFKTKSEKAEILAEIQKVTWIKDPIKQEEWAARNFERYVKGKIPTKSSKLLQFFKDLWEKIKSVFKEKSVIDKFYDDILNKNKDWSPVEKWEGIQKYQSNLMAYDPISFDFIKRVAKIEAQEQRIGKVGNNKVGAEAKDKQMRQREKDKESLIEDIWAEYGLDTNEAYDKYDDFNRASYETINMTKSELNKKMKEQMEKYYGKEEYATHEEKTDAVQREVKKMIRARNKWRDIEEMKAYNSAMKALDKVDKNGKELSKDFYEKNKAIWKKKQGTRHSVKEFVSDTLEPVSYRLWRISRAIKTRVREFDFAEMYGTKKLIDESRIFLDKMKELRKDPEKFNEADLALKNWDMEKLGELEIEVPRGVLDALHDRALEHGIEVEYRKDYFPRSVENAKWLLDKLRGTDARWYVSDAIKERTKLMGRELTLEERADIANKLLSGYSVDGIRINMKNLKERTIDVITSELNQFYADPIDWYLNYISGMTRAIELKRLFGNEEADKAIGTFVAEMLENKQLKPKDEEELTKLLKVRFSPAVTSKFVSALRWFISWTTMWSPISTLSQIQDIATSIFESWIWNILKKWWVDMTKDLGIEAISNEFSDQSVMQKTLENIFTVTWFKAMDRLGKQTMINSYFNKIKEQAKTDNPKLKTDLMEMFGNNEKRVNQIIADLKKWELTEDGKFLLFNKVADYQPITQSEMPYGYLKSWNTRLLYVLKSFSLKQIESLRREGIDIMKDNFRKRKTLERDMKAWRIGEDEWKKKQKEAVKWGIQWAKNLLTLAGSLLVLGATIDEVKDLIMMRKSSNILNLINDQPTDLGWRLFDNLLRLSWLSKYTIYQANKAGIWSAIQSIISMPTSAVDQIYRDMMMIFTNKNLNEWEKLKALESVQSLPVLGKLYYWWFGQPTMTSKHFDITNPAWWLQQNKYSKDIFTWEIKPKKNALSDIKPNKVQKIKKTDLSKIKPKRW